MQPEPRLTAGLPDIYMPPRTTRGTWQTREKQGSRILTRYCFGAFRALPGRDIAVIFGYANEHATRASWLTAPAAETFGPDVPDHGIWRTAKFDNNWAGRRCRRLPQSPGQ